MGSPFDATQVAPWRTWGNSANLRLFGQGPAVTSAGQPNQLVNVEYDRPDTWSWLFSATLRPDLNTFFNIDPGGSVRVGFDVTLGVGRSNLQVQNFATLDFSIATLNTGNPQTITLANAANSSNGVNPGTDPSPLGDTIRVDVRDIPAQAIQITAVVRVLGLVGFLDCDITAFAAPRSHFRREWVVDDEQDWRKPL